MLRSDDSRAQIDAAARGPCAYDRPRRTGEPLPAVAHALLVLARMHRRRRPVRGDRMGGLADFGTGDRLLQAAVPGDAAHERPRVQRLCVRPCTGSRSGAIAPCHRRRTRTPNSCATACSCARGPFASCVQLAQRAHIVVPDDPLLARRSLAAGAGRDRTARVWPADRVARPGARGAPRRARRRALGRSDDSVRSQGVRRARAHPSGIWRASKW